MFVLRYSDIESESTSTLISPLYTDGLFHCYMLDESICHFRGVGTVVLLLFCGI